MWGAVTNQQGNGVIYFTRWEKKQILLNSYDAMEGQKVMKIIGLRRESCIQRDGNTWLISVWHSMAVISEFPIPGNFLFLESSANT